MLNGKRTQIFEINGHWWKNEKCDSQDELDEIKDEFLFDIEQLCRNYEDHKTINLVNTATANDDKNSVSDNDNSSLSSLSYL